MNRIEEIKERLNQFKTNWQKSRGCCDVEDFSDDVAYLLSELEIAEKSLEQIRKFSSRVQQYGARKMYL